MKLEYYQKFIKHFRKRIEPNPNLFKRFEERVQIFLSNPNDPILKDHQLKGDKANFRAFSITGDIRVVYHKGEDYIYFIDIGTHNQVY